MSTLLQPSPSDEDLERLIALVRKGDSSQLGILLDLYRGYLLTIAARQMSPDVATKTAPSDVVQETLFEASQGFLAFRGKTEFELREWLNQILARNVADLRRFYRESGKRKTSLEVSFDADQRNGSRPFDVARNEKSPSQFAVAAEDAGLLMEGLKKLSEEQRLVIELKSFDKLTFAEIGNRLGKTMEAARKIFARAVEELSKDLRRREK